MAEEFDSDAAIAGLRAKMLEGSRAQVSAANAAAQERWQRETRPVTWSDRRPRKAEIKSAQLNLKVTERDRASVFAAATARRTAASVLMMVCFEYCMRDQAFAAHLEQALGRAKP